jgi:hypothetical protein
MRNSGFRIAPPQPPKGGFPLIQALARVAPGWWWDIWLVAEEGWEGNPEGRMWLGMAEGDPEAVAQEVKENWPQFAGKMVIEERYKKLPISRAKLRK